MAGEVEAKFAVKLDDGVSGTADQAAAALKRLKGSIDADKAALSQMQGAMRAMQGAGSVNIAAFRELSARIDAQKQKIGDATSKYVQLGGTFGKVKKGSDDAKGGLAGMLDAVKGAPGPLGSMAARLSSMTSMLPAVAAAAGIFAVIAGLGALVVAVGAATASLLKYGLAQAEARRNELGRLEGLTLMRTRYHAAAGSAEDLQRAIDGVSASSSTGRGDLEGMTERLYRLGFRGAALERALQGATTATEVLGERGGNRFVMMAAHARRTGGSIDALADRIQARLGPAAARRALSWDSQIARLGRNFSQIFGGLRIDGLLTQLKRVTDIFSLNQASGRALKQLFETIFQPFVDDAGRAMPVIENLILHGIIGAQNLMIVVNDLRLAYLRAFGTQVQEGMTNVTARAGLLAGVMQSIGTNARVGIALFQMVTRTLGGNAITAGLVAGTDSGRGVFASSMRALAAAGVNAFKEAMGIRSPSRVFAGLGYQLPAGVARGIDQGTPEVEHAVRHMVSVPSAPDMQAVTDVSPAGRGGGAPVSISFGDIIVSGASGEPRDIAQAIRDEVVTMLQGVAISMGAPT